MRRFAPYIILSLLILASCTSNSGKSEEVNPADKQKEVDDSGTVRIAVTPTVDCMPFFVAKDEGLFEQAGLKVRLVMFNAHMDIDTALVGGSVDGAFSDIVRCEKLQKKEKITLEYLTTTDAQWTLVSHRKTRLKKLDSFGDEMVGMTRFSATDYLTDQAFKDVKLKDNTQVYRIQVNNVKIRTQMLLSDNDGMTRHDVFSSAWLPEPYATVADTCGHNRVFESAKTKERLGVIAFRGKYAKNKNNKAVLTTLAKVYSQACDSINKNWLVGYSAEMQKYCNADTAIVNRIPKFTFTHTEKPSEEFVGKIRTYLGK